MLSSRTTVAIYLPKPSRNLLAALSIAVSSSPLSTAVLTTSNTFTKSFSTPTSIAYLGVSEDCVFVCALSVRTVTATLSNVCAKFVQRTAAVT